jgi:hypothetical protein
LAVRGVAAACVLSVAVVAGCGVEDSTAPPMTDPVAILEQALESTAGLGSVRARFTLGASGAQEELDGAGGDVELDLEEFELAGTVTLPPMLGGGTTSVLYADRELFTRTDGGGWIRVGGNGEADPLVFLPPVAKLADALDAALDEPGVTATLSGSDACGSATCYHVTVGAPAETVWLTLQRLQGLEGLDAPMPEGIPPVEFEAWVDRAELRLVRLHGEVADADGGGLVLEVELSDHDAEVDLTPPPSADAEPTG